MNNNIEKYTEKYKFNKTDSIFVLYICDYLYIRFLLSYPIKT